MHLSSSSNSSNRNSNSSNRNSNSSNRLHPRTPVNNNRHCLKLRRQLDKEVAVVRHALTGSYKQQLIRRSQLTSRLNFSNSLSRPKGQLHLRRT